MDTGLLFLRRSDVETLLDLPSCIAAMEEAFRMRAEDRALAPALMHLDTEAGEFHIKGGGLRMERPYVALKANGGFFHNRERFGLPNILGLITLFDGTNGRPLAVMDSIGITVLRTGATTAVAARLLARPGAEILTICGCGRQGDIQLRALLSVLPSIRQVWVWDAKPETARAFAAQAGDQLGLPVEAAPELAAATLASDIIVTCTPARGFYLRREHVRPGTFVAAVGSDSPDKQEVDPALVACSKLVVDVLEQCARVGELHHALDAGLMTTAEVHGELGDLVAGRIPGRTSDREITLFDATGSAIQDTAAAVMVYRKALAGGLGLVVDPFA
jgi:ornithine cyclodeaminase/alanine dehydrogenase